MKIDEIIKKIEKEQKRVHAEVQNSDGLLRLQKVAEKYQGEYQLEWSYEIRERLKNQSEETKFFTEIDKLDYATGGFRPQQLIVLAAHTKHGKTSCGLFLIDKLSQLNPVFIPLEQSAEEIIKQRDENGYSIPNFLSPYRLAPQVTVDWIEYRVIEGVAKYNTKLVMIDNLDWIDKGDGKENLAYRIGEVMRGLKAIAQRWNVVIILQSHIHQADEENLPILKDIKNSSDIAQNSDLVLMLWRENYTLKKEKKYTNKAVLSIQANRRTGKNENIKFEFNSQNGMFDQNEWERTMEEEAQKIYDYL